MFLSAKETASKPDSVNILLALDWCDSQRHLYLQHDQNWPTASLCATSDFGNAAAGWRYLYSVGKGEIVHMCADDLVYLSKGWDERFREELSVDPLQILCYRDDLRNDAIACNPVTTRHLIRAAALPGYLPQAFEHWFSDTFYDDIGRRAGCLKYLPDVRIVQEHPKNGLAPMDATYARNRLNDGLTRGRQAFDATTDLRVAASDRIRLLKGMGHRQGNPPEA